MVYKRMDLSLILTLYGPYALNLFIKTSTWLVVMLALYRHVAISLNMSGKRYLTSLNTLLSVLGCFIVWVFLLFPLTWSWEARNVTCQPGKSILILHIGKFERDLLLRRALTHTWTAIGFLIPVCILAYCNVMMILSLRTTLRKTSHITNPTSAGRHRRLIAHRRMTITLITIVASFFILVFPSELTHYYLELFYRNSSTRGPMVNSIMTCNMLQAINMSINFILYCACNCNFRETLWAMLPKCTSNCNGQDSYNMNENGNYSTLPLNTTSVMCTEL